MMIFKKPALLFIFLFSTACLAQSAFNEITCHLHTYEAVDGWFDRKITDSRFGPVDLVVEAGSAWECFQKSQLVATKAHGKYFWNMRPCDGVDCDKNEKTFYYIQWAYIGYGINESGLVSAFTSKCYKSDYPKKARDMIPMSQFVTKDYLGSHLFDQDCNRLDNY